LKDACNYHSKKDKKIVMHPGGLPHGTWEGKDFLQEIQEKVSVVHPPQYMSLAGPNRK
jgi:hypothetical protein